MENRFDSYHVNTRLTQFCKVHVRSEDRSVPRDLTAITPTFFFPTSDKVSFHGQCNTPRFQKTPEIRKIMRMLASLHSEFELVLVQVSFRREVYTSFYLRLTGTFWMVELFGKCTMNVHFSCSVTALLQSFFGGSQKARKLCSRNAYDRRVFFHVERIISEHSDAIAGCLL